jgi:hypothetical protein
MRVESYRSDRHCVQHLLDGMSGKVSFLGQHIVSTRAWKRPFEFPILKQ